MKTAVEFLEEIIYGEQEFSLSEVFEQANEIEENLAQQYAEFSILCDRREMNPIKFKDWCKQYNEKTI
jgi:hypothetical protein